MKRHHRMLIGGGLMALTIWSFNVPLFTFTFNHLDVVGPDSVVEDVCATKPLKITIKSILGRDVVATKDIPVTLFEANWLGKPINLSAASFFTDAACTNEIHKIIIPDGSASASVYVRYASIDPKTGTKDPLKISATLGALSDGYITGNMLVRLFSNVSGATTSFKIGFNDSFDSDEIEKMIATPSRYGIYTPIFAQYNLKYMRWPGGGATRYYFADDDGTTNDQGENLSTIAIHKLGEYQIKKGGKKQDVYPTRVIHYPGNYEKFLQFVVATGVKPIISINSMLYHIGTAVYPTELFLGTTKGIDIGLQPDRWTAIEREIQNQVNVTHSIISGPVDFEIGNEDYSVQFAAGYYDVKTMHDGTIVYTHTTTPTAMPAGYCDVVTHYVNVIKGAYPTDTVTVALSRGNFQNSRTTDPNPTTGTGDEWNQDLINCLSANGVLAKIDFFAPHYYYGSEFDTQTQAELDQRILTNQITNGLFADLKSYFPGGYTPKFFVTEFSPSLTTDNKNFNTQMNAMLMFDYLMKFHAEPSVAGVIKHTGFHSKNGSFFSGAAVLVPPFPTYVIAGKGDTSVFAYTPPQTDAVRLFEATTGDTVRDFILTNSYELLATAIGSKQYIQILNYETSDQTIDLSKYGSGSYTTYVLPDFTDHYWDTEANKTTGNVGASQHITVPGHSFTTVLVQ